MTCRRVGTRSQISLRLSQAPEPYLELVVTNTVDRAAVIIDTITCVSRYGLIGQAIPAVPAPQVAIKPSGNIGKMIATEG